jgi:hypothetical protein
MSKIYYNPTTGRILLTAPFLMMEAASPLTDGLVSHWTLNESSGSAIDTMSLNNLPIYGGITQGSGGKLSTSYTFDGSTGYIGTIDTTYELTTAISISFWVYLNAIDITQAIVSNYYFNGKGFDLIVESNNLIYWVVRDSAQTPTSCGIISTTALAATTWYHVLATFDGTYARLYLNGAQDGGDSSAWNHNISYDVTCRFELGRRVDEFYLNGRLDDVAIWNLAKPASAAVTLYNSGAGIAYPFVV